MPPRTPMPPLSSTQHYILAGTAHRNIETPIIPLSGVSHGETEGDRSDLSRSIEGDPGGVCNRGDPFRDARRQRTVRRRRRPHLRSPGGIPVHVQDCLRNVAPTEGSSTRRIGRDLVAGCAEESAARSPRRESWSIVRSYCKQVDVRTCWNRYFRILPSPNIRCDML